MKKALSFKLAVIITVLAVFAVNTPLFSVFSAKPDEYELPFVHDGIEHDWDNGVITTPPTCTQPGVKTYTCRYNASHTYTETVPPKGHRPAELVIENEVAATDSTRGSFDEVLYCFVCEEEVSRTRKSVGIDGDIRIAGDINDDGALNNKDLTCLFKNLSGWDADVNAAALDINDDGAVNNKDMTRLFKYLSGWDVEIF